MPVDPLLPLHAAFTTKKDYNERTIINSSLKLHHIERETRKKYRINAREPSAVMSVKKIIFNLKF
jgi:hypothetical protein